jgi:hypothetical protein
MLLTAAVQLAAASLGPPSIEWGKTFGGAAHDMADDVVQTGDGGFVLAGYTGSFGAGSQDFWVVKIDAFGTTEWDRTYGGAQSDEARCIAETSDGGFVLAGNTQSFGMGGSDFWLIKTDSLGDVEWNRAYGGPSNDDCHFVRQTGDGGFILTGETWSFGAGSSDFWVVKVDAAGNVEWQNAYGGTGEDHAYAVAESVDGGYVVAGYTQSFGAGNRDFWLVKVDALGTLEWHHAYGGPFEERCHALIRTADGGYVLAGFTNSFGAGGRDFWLVKTDGAGTVVWESTYGGASDDWATSLTPTADGGYLLAGVTSSFGAGSYDFWLVHTDALGTLQWNTTLGGTSDDRAFSVIQTRDGGYAVAGVTQSFGAGNGDMWLIKGAPEVTPVLATVDIDPDTLNLKSKGRWITAYIELPNDYDVTSIDASTILLNHTIPVDLEAPSETGDHDGDGVPDLMVKFSRQTVHDITSEGEATLTITGRLQNGNAFEGNDVVRIINAGKDHIDESDPSSIEH